MKPRNHLIAILLPGIAVLSLSLGFWGYYLYEHKYPVDWNVNYQCDNPFYFACQLFFWNSPALKEALPWQLEVARYLSPLVTLTTVLSFLYAAFRNSWEHFRISRWSGHTILCGAGVRSLAIASKLTDPKRGRAAKKVVVIEPDSENPNLMGLKSKGIPIIRGDALDAAVLTSAGIRKAERLLALTPKPETNIAICNLAAGISDASCDLYAGVESPDLLSYLGSTPRMATSDGKREIVPLSFQIRSARKLMVGIATELAEKSSNAIKEKGAHLIIEAVNPYRDELIRAAAVMLQIAGEVLPKLLITKVTEEEKLNFLDRYPEADRVAEIFWHPGSCTDYLKSHPDFHPVAAVIALSSDASTLEVAQKISHRHELGADRIRPLFWHDSVLATMGGTGLKPEILFNLALDSHDPIKCDEERVAQEIHDTYEKQQSEKPGHAPKHWSNLGEYEKEVNRLAALHFPVKVAAWNSLKLEDSEKLDLLFRAEHMRWWAQRAMDGWRLGDRDFEKRVHPCLKPFDDLEDEYRGNDRNVVELALKMRGINVGLPS